MKFKGYIFLLLLFVYAQTKAQTTVIDGFIKEKGSGEPLGYAHVQLIGTNVGTTSDTSGYFKLEINNSALKGDSIIISFLGYQTTKIRAKAGNDETVTVELKPEFFQLQEFSMTPGEPQSWYILRNVIANKDKNNPDAKTNYYCEEYSKMRFDLNHFTDKIKKNILVRPFDYIWDKVDTTPDGITYLPVLLAEKSIEHYYQSSPREKKDYVNAEQNTGLAGPKIMKFAEDMYQAPNFYDNYIVILDKSFPSPINDNYKNNYKFYLNDSTGSGPTKCYRITFRPKLKNGLAFTGEMTIDSSAWALKSITVRFDILANVNFVRSFRIDQKYEPIDGKNWMLKQSDVLGDFTVIENSADLTGFFGRKSSTFLRYKVDSVVPQNVFKGTEMVVVADSAKFKTEENWKNLRRLDLTKEDTGIFNMAHRLAKDPRFIFRKNLADVITSGFYPFKYFDIGDVYTFYSYNSIEHSRIGFGVRTNEKPGLPLSTTEHIAYGTYDAVWKYNFSAAYSFGNLAKHKKQIGASYSYDIYQLGRSFNNLALDNIFSSFIQVGSVDASRNYSRDFNTYFDNTWASGLVTRLNYFNNEVTPTPGTNFNEFVTTGGNHVVHNAGYKSVGIDITLKYSWQNKNANGSFYDADDFKNTYKKYPNISLQWKMADKNTFGSQFNFQKIKLSLNQQIHTKKLGYLKYYIEAGKTYGTVPYPYLDIPFGSQIVFLDGYAFNLMNFMEYASDQYASVSLEQHIEGLLLDRVPLVKKLKWRNFLFAKGYFGKLSDANYNSGYLFPSNLQRTTNPYYEVGFGIENIFKIARMDFIWRLTDTDKPNAYYFIIKPSLNFSF